MPKIFKRLFCPHFYWHNASPFEVGIGRGLIICDNCGKVKLIESKKDCEVLSTWTEYYLKGESK